MGHIPRGKRQGVLRSGFRAGQAVAFVQEQGRMSISLLQRRFRIGFNKAARFVERMEEEGILPPASRANKARTVRMD